MKLTRSERIEIFRPHVMLQRLDNQEAAFVQHAMFYVREQAEYIAIQYAQGKTVNQLYLAPNPVKGIAGALAQSMIETYSIGEFSIQNELIHAEQIHQAKATGVYQPNIVPFAVNEAFYPEAGTDWYQNYTLRLAGVHSVDALNNTKEAISKGIEQGLNQEDTVNLIKNQFPSFSEHRLENIARTETAKIYEQSRYQQMDSDETIVGYEICAIMDSRTSDICRSRDGMKIPKDKIDGWLPPYHYQCRTVLLPIFDWETKTQYDIESTAVDAQPGFGSVDMAIPESARNAIHIPGLPELRKTVKVVETPKVPIVKTPPIVTGMPDVKLIPIDETISAKPVLAEREQLLKQISEYVNNPNELQLDSVLTENLKDILDGLETVLKPHNIKLTKLSVNNHLKKANARATNGEGIHEIEYSKDVATKSKQSLLQEYADTTKLYNHRRSQYFDELQKEIDKADLGSLKRLNQIVLDRKKQIKVFGSTVSSDNPVRNTTMHEAGHVLSHHKGILDKWSVSVKANRLKRDMHLVSEYALTDDAESFAEITAFVNSGRSSVIPKTILDAYNAVLKEAFGGI